MIFHRGGIEMAKLVVATFQDQVLAQRAAKEIQNQGLRTDDISIVAKTNETTNQIGSTDNAFSLSMRDDQKTQMRADDVSDGIMTGGLLGGIAGILIGAGTMMIPGFGAIAAAGPITGLLTGAVTGGVVGGLVDLGIPEEKSRSYQDKIQKGKVLFAMKTPDEVAAKVEQVLNQCGCESVETIAQ